MRPSTRKWILLAAAAAVFYAASTQVRPLDDLRTGENLALPALPEKAQPSMLLTPLLAVGRAPLVDYLWMRATTLKDEGRFFDAYQLSQMICELQPKFASVWAFQAWNMSYNISVTLRTPEERWRWVRNGYELLRDKGIPLNPTSTQLYRELAWILFHKVGDYMDEWHYYYKLQFALQMEDILGEPPDDYVRPGRVRGDYYRDYDFKSLAEAPATFEELSKKPGVAPFVERLKEFGFDAGKEGIFLGLLSALKKSDVRLPNVRPGEEANRLHDLEAFMSDPATREAQVAIEHFWRAQRLKNEVKLDPQRILDLQKTYDLTFDFRLPDSHALYWAYIGLEKGIDTREYIDVHRLNTNRLEFFCLQKIFHRGRMAMSPNARLGEPPLFSPDLRVVPVLFDAYLRDSEKYLNREKENKVVSTNFETGFVGFVRSAILRYYEAGMEKEAREKFDYLKEHFPDPMYDKGLSGFIAKQFLLDRELGDHRVAMSRIGLLVRDAMLMYAYDEDDQAVRRMNRAKQVYDTYQQGTSSDRMKIPRTFAQIVEEVVQGADWGRGPRDTYEKVCRKLGIEPLPQAPTSAPAEGALAP
ncbi:MAG TPA: hypothetical protein VMV94_21275 [Phycisphaerae bacterium]|nr:hypothetical protein [Phycisphaerae bacterium]